MLKAKHFIIAAIAVFLISFAFEQPAPAADPFASYQKSLVSSATTWVSITPNNSTEIDVPRAIYVGGAGDISLTGSNDVAVTFVGVAAGTTLSVRPKIIRATGTTATSIVALY